MLYGFGFSDMRRANAIPVLPFFNLVMVWNPAVSYGLFPATWRLGNRTSGAVFLVAVAGFGLVAVAVRTGILAVGLGLVIGGALGNLIDRLIYGEVADFFHFYAFGYDWYVFNVADAAITFGVVALLYDALLQARQRRGRTKLRIRRGDDRWNAHAQFRCAPGRPDRRWRCR